MHHAQTLTPGEAEATLIVARAQSTAVSRMREIDAPTRTPAPPADTATPLPTWTVQPTATDAPTATGTPEPTHTATIAPTVTVTAEARAVPTPSRSGFDGTLAGLVVAFVACVVLLLASLRRRAL
jgi:hypothetical protein